MAVKDKVVIITGGAMGIGRYNARAFAAAGAKLAIGTCSIVFDTIFIVQHYVLYRHNRADPWRRGSSASGADGDDAGALEAAAAASERWAGAREVRVARLLRDQIDKVRVTLLVLLLQPHLLFTFLLEELWWSILFMFLGSKWVSY